MRILIAIGVSRQAAAGAASVVLNHTRELEKRGHSVECWFLEDVLPGPARSKRFEALLFASRVAKQILRARDKYDVVNLHAPWGCAYGLWKKLLRPAGAPPYVLTMQGSEERYVYAMTRENRKGRAATFGWRNRAWHRLYHQMMYDFSITTADYGAVANREAWICAELKYNRDPGKFRFVANGTENRFFVNRDFRQETPLRLLYVGTWLDRKGVIYLAEAFRLLASRNKSMRLTVAGCINPEEEVRRSFSSELQDRVDVIPTIEREHMPALYADHDIFVFPSLMEGMPLVLLEAMAAAMPVVTTESSGMADVVEHGFNGLLVTPADAGMLAKSIQQLHDSPELRRQLGIEAQNTMRRYTWERVTILLEELLTAAVGQETIR